MNKYETLFILKPDLSDDEVESSIERLTSRIDGAKGKLAAIDHWGVRRLAYSIRYRGEKLKRGYYVLLSYIGDGETVEEVERNIKIMDPIFRFLTTKLDGEFSPEEVGEVEVTKKEPVAEQRPRYVEDESGDAVETPDKSTPEDKEEKSAEESAEETGEDKPEAEAAEEEAPAAEEVADESEGEEEAPQEAPAEETAEESAEKTAEESTEESAEAAEESGEEEKE